MSIEEHKAECKRRSQLANTDLVDDDRRFKRAETDIEFEFDDISRKFVVFSLSQTGFAPFSLTKDNPAVCIIGAFATNEEAVNHAIAINKMQGISVFVDETHKWIAAVKSKECMTTEYVDNHVDRLLAHHKSLLHANKQDFEKNVREQKVGSVSRAENEAAETSAPEKEGKPHSIMSGADVRGQKLCVCSIIKDESPTPEFIFKVYAFVDNMSEANAYVRNVCGDKVEEYDIDVVSTCEWIYPQKMTYDKVKKEVFRSDELDSIMKTHRNNSHEVDNFYKSCEDSK
jgi:hypothetical protein